MNGGPLPVVGVFDGTARGQPRCARPGALKERKLDFVVCGANPSPGMFHLWPVNRFFSNFGDTGGRVERLLRQKGIDPGGPAAIDAEIAATELVRLMHRVMRLTGDELWGLRSRPTKLGTFLQACRLAVHAGNVEQALRAAFRFYHGLFDDFTLRLTRDNDLARITLIDTMPQRPGRDMMHVLILQVLRTAIEWLSGRADFVERVEFQYPPLPREEILETLFRAGVINDALHTSLVVDATVLARPVLAEAGQVDGFVASLPSKVALVFQNRRSVAERTVSYIHARGDWNIGREDVAEVLNMSVATFRRRLHQDIGCGFQELKDQLRCAAARKLLAAEDVKLDQVAHLLGFSEFSSFHRAFRRWTGQGPGSYRYALH